jgi:hypothetical protein
LISFFQISALKEIQISDEETQLAVKGWSDKVWKAEKKAKKADVVLPIKVRLSFIIRSFIHS